MILPDCVKLNDFECSQKYVMLHGNQKVFKLSIYILK